MAPQVILVFGFILLVNDVRGVFEGSLCTRLDSDASASCEDQDSRCPSSASCLTIQWVETEPYSYEDERGILTGPIPELLENILVECCRDCWSVYLTKVEKAKPNESDVVFPYIYQSKKSKVGRMMFLPLVENPSVVFVTKRPGTKGISGQLIKSVWNAWPVLVVALFLSLHAGVLLWMMEFGTNAEEFPVSFTKGSWEGFWWAFVSMTTVGYGDRAPRSILGRAFAIAWILIGICICSIFTATLTTALTTISLEEVKTVNRAKVGAIRNSLEARIGVEYQGKVIPYNTSEALWRALSNGQVDGILLDSFYSATPSLRARIQDNDLKVSQTVTAEGWAYGMLVPHSDFAECLEENDLDDYNIYDWLTDKIESEETDENEATKRSSSVFDPKQDVFWPILCVCIVCTVIIIIFGVVWELVLLPRLKRKTEASVNEPSGKPPNLDHMEKEMIGEVKRLFNEWRVKMGEKLPMASVEEIELS